ncbi:hypothetical protein [Intrasporangium sp.]|uniref:hypothetical protein n=1 Tax=Intrasporangium sp. TaxID=1925024 RepID=UPI0032215E99
MPRTDDVEVTIRRAFAPDHESDDTAADAAFLGAPMRMSVPDARRLAVAILELTAHVVD